MDFLVSSLSQGIIWSIMAVGVYITFRLLNIADLSAEGVFPLGASLGASLIIAGLNPYLACIAAFFIGGVAGWLAGFIHTKMKINPLFTGILLQTGLYSINIKVAGGKANLALIGQDTIYSGLQELLNISKNLAMILVGLLVLAFIIIALVLFLNTEIGMALRSTGDNEKMSLANGINIDRMKTLGYMISNGIIALAGAMIAQKDGFFDIGMGIGTIVIALASIIIAEVILPNRSLGQRLASIILGSFIYRLIIDLILNQRLVEIQSTDLRLFSALLLGLVLVVPELQKTMKLNQIAKGGR